MNDSLKTYDYGALIICRIEDKMAVIDLLKKYNLEVMEQFYEFKENCYKIYVIVPEDALNKEEYRWYFGSIARCIRYDEELRWMERNIKEFVDDLYGKKN